MKIRVNMIIGLFVFFIHIANVYAETEPTTIVVKRKKGVKEKKGSSLRLTLVENE